MIACRVVRIRGSGGPEVLSLEEGEIAPPGPDQLLVRVHAAALNRADVLQRKGLYPPPPGVPPDVPGLEYAGVVEAAGASCRQFAVGDRVMGIVGGGAMATHVVVSEREAMPIPAPLDFSEAAAIPEAFLTAFDALFVQGGLRFGERVLLHAVASGVGTAALQIVQAAGAFPIGTSRSAEKLERCKELGLEAAVHVASGSFADEVRRLSGGDGVDVVIDLVGASYLKENLRSLATSGRIVAVGLLGGAKAELSLGALLEKRATLIGTLLRPRPPEAKASLAQRFAKEALPAFANGTLRPVVDRVLPFAEVAEGHRLLEGNATFGKVVLSWDD